MHLTRKNPCRGDSRSRWVLEPLDFRTRVPDVDSIWRSLSCDEFSGSLDLAEAELLGSRLEFDCRLVGLDPVPGSLRIAFAGKVVGIDGEGGLYLDGRLRAGDSVAPAGALLHLGRFHRHAGNEHLELELSGSFPLGPRVTIRVEGSLDASRPLPTA